MAEIKPNPDWYKSPPNWTYIYEAENIVAGHKMQEFCPRINVFKGNFFKTIIEPLYFLKSCPIFDELAFPVFTKYNGFL